MMIYYYFKNNFLSTLLIVILVLMILYFLVKYGLPVKSKAKEKPKEKSTPAAEEKEEKPVAAKDDNLDAQKQKNEPAITEKIETTEDKNEEDLSRVYEADYDKKVKEFNDKYQFDELKKGVSKIKLRKSDATTKLVSDLDLSEIQTNTSEKQERRIRLSDAVKENDFNKMFVSHLSDKYININPNLHLQENGGIFDRTNKMIDNSLQQFGEDHLSYSEIEEEKREQFVHDILDEIEGGIEEGQIEDSKYIDVKTMILSEMILNRKNAKKNN